MQPWFTVHFFGIGHPCCDQLIPVKTRHPLTSIMWPYRGLKLTAHWCQVFFWSWPLTRCWFFDWIVGSCLVMMSGQQGRIVRKPVNAHPGLNVNQIITFSSMQMSLLLFLCIWWLLKLRTRRPNKIQKTSAQSYKTQIKILLFPGLA